MNIRLGWPPWEREDDTVAAESLAAIRNDVRRERLLDMQQRLRPYRLAAYLVLAASLAVLSPEIGVWWVAPLGAAMLGFWLADRFMARSARPALWVSGAWGAVAVLIAIAVALTGGAESPALPLFALPAVTLGARFEPRGVVLGSAWVISLLLLCTYGLDREVAAEHYQYVIAAITVVLCTVILSGAVGSSDRLHRRRSTLDPLTGLYNRNALEQRLAELDGTPSGEELGSHALLLCDLDHFKRVNDRLGHATGDAVLQDVAYAMRSLLRAGDSIYRVGGEEILVVLPGAGRTDAVEIAERLRHAVRECRPAGIEVTVSIGIAVSGEGEVDTDALVDQADAALYAAKENGRDRIALGSWVSGPEAGPGEMALPGGGLSG